MSEWPQPAPVQCWFHLKAWLRQHPFIYINIIYYTWYPRQVKVGLLWFDTQTFQEELHILPVAHHNHAGSEPIDGTRWTRGRGTRWHLGSKLLSVSFRVTRRRTAERSADDQGAARDEPPRPGWEDMWRRKGWKHQQIAPSDRSWVFSSGLWKITYRLAFGPSFEEASGIPGPTCFFIIVCFGVFESTRTIFQCSALSHCSITLCFTVLRLGIFQSPSHRPARLYFSPHFGTPCLGLQPTPNSPGMRWNNMCFPKHHFMKYSEHAKATLKRSEFTTMSNDSCHMP